MRPTTASSPNDDDEKIQLKSRIRDLELVIGLRDESLAATLRLTPVLNNLMGLLMNVPVVTPEMIRQRLEIAPDAKVAIHRLRAHLKSHDIKIQSRRNVGYWLEDEDKLNVRELVRVKMGGMAVTPKVVVDNSSDEETLEDLPFDEGAET